MKRNRVAALALMLVVLSGSLPRGYAEAPIPPKDKPDPSAQPQLQQAPAMAPSSGEAPSAPASNPTLSPSGILGLSMTQVFILAAVAVVFICMAILMRWWLSEPAAEEAETPPAADPQDIPQ
jgi:hypothetical protein